MNDKFHEKLKDFIKMIKKEIFLGLLYLHCPRDHLVQEQEHQGQMEQGQNLEQE